MKTCSRCGAEKPLEAFHRMVSTRDGRRPDCKACVNEYYRAYYEANKGKIAERDRAYREANREAIAEQNRAYYKANREKIAEQKRSYREANREAINEYQRAYHAANPHVGWANGYHQRAIAYGFEPIVEEFTKADVMARYGAACFYCGGALERLDHAVPVSRGGPHTLENARPSCAGCDSSKSVSTEAEWAALRSNGGRSSLEAWLVAELAPWVIR